MREAFPETLRIILEPIVAYLDDPAVTTIFVNGPDEIWIEKEGVLTRGEAKGRFTEGILLDAVRAAARAAGGGLSGEATRLDARLSGGARITAVLPPIARKGPCLVLRKADETKPSLADLVSRNALSASGRRFLEAAVRARRNIVVYGSAGSGRTTLLAGLASLAPETDRVLVAEATPEIKLPGIHVVPVALGDHPADLIEAIPSLRADLAVIGDLAGAEALPVVRLMSGGLPVLTSVTGNSATDALMRIEGLCHLSGKELSSRALRGLIAAGIDLLVGTARFPDGSRRVIGITECRPLGIDGEFQLADVFVAPRSGTTGPPGALEPCGIVPLMAQELRNAGFADLEPSFFGSNGEPPLPAFAAARPTGAASPTGSLTAALRGGDSPPAPPSSLGATRPGEATPARRRAAPPPRSSPGSTMPGTDPYGMKAVDESVLPTMRSVEFTGMPSEEPPSVSPGPGVVIGGAAVAGRYSRPDSPYVIEGTTGMFGDVPPKPQGERTLPGMKAHGASGDAAEVPVTLTPDGPPLEAVEPTAPSSSGDEGGAPEAGGNAGGIAGPAAGGDAPEAEAAVAAPAPVAVEADPFRGRSPRTTLAVDVPTIRRRDGEDSGAQRAVERRAATGGGPRVVPAESPRAHLAGTKEYPALRLGGDNGSTAPEAAVGALVPPQPADELVEEESSDPFAGWDDEARRELEEDRRRREAAEDKRRHTLIAEDVDLDAPLALEERGEDTNPRADVPEGFED